MMKMFYSAACGLAFAAFASAPSHASTVSLDVLGTPYASLVSAQINGQQVEPRGSNQFEAGGFDMVNTATSEEFIAWCIEVEVLINADEARYRTGRTLVSSSRENLLSRLFTGYVDQTATDVGAAAFQLAIWEIVEESRRNMADLNVLDGRFTAGSTADDVIETANGFLTGLADFDARYRFDYFQNRHSQDVIAASPVPLPAGIVLLGAALGGLAAVRRRRSAQSTEA